MATDGLIGMNSIIELSKPASERELSNSEIGKALDAVIKFTLRNLKVDYSAGTCEYDYRLNIGGKIILISWKMGNLENNRYRNNLLGEVKRTFEHTNAHEFI
jgi:hypothetical protein